MKKSIILITIILLTYACATYEVPERPASIVDDNVLAIHNFKQLSDNDFRDYVWDMIKDWDYERVEWHTDNEGRLYVAMVILAKIK